MKGKIVIISDEHRNRAISIIQNLPLDPPHEFAVKEHKKDRSAEQNARMWAMLTDVSQQVEWYEKRLTKEEWKDVFTASLKQQKVVPGIEGGFVVIGVRTSKMSISDMSELIEFAMAFGCQHQVKWRDNRE